jgi:sigma-B regulation protein RsbU (phosphoserine phosphatase)
MVRQKLDVARDVQQRLLPREAPQFPGFDISGDLRALESAGGDYYDYIPMQGGSLGVVIADVSGHGIGAAMLMAVTRAYLRAEAAARLDLKEIATRVNRLLSDDLHNRWIVTMFFAKLDPESRSIEYAAAGHESYIIRADDTLVTLRSTSPPLGVLDDGIIECGPAEQLHEGDVLLLLTDGLVEALSPLGEPFGLHRIRQSVIENREKAAIQIVKSLQAAMITHCGSGEPHDDVTIVAIKATGDVRGTDQRS